MKIEIFSPAATRSAEFAHLLWLASGYSAEKLKYTITHEISQMTTIGFRDGTFPIAFASYIHEPSRAVIEYIAVKETHQGMGLGSQLLNAVAKTHPEIYLETDDDAVDFYRKQGFSIAPKDRDPRWPDRERYACVWRKN
ncbi:GNAT family N-acetyltransferase [Corynebacterium glutamicum]|uniref:GNAT family N-acetyltransferase n=1 Tax=Corynebacterium glutamicum TaxID=1718 RepID=UPI000945AD9A|nr:GNAT family N-acetyltransferase [Corynebacterium glutamicum]OKX83579.1 GNAT family N-acetyltransferase [Corynebacterium glutamicum]